MDLCELIYSCCRLELSMFNPSTQYNVHVYIDKFNPSVYPYERLKLSVTLQGSTVPEG